MLRSAGRIKFRLFDNLGNLVDDKITSSKAANVSSVYFDSNIERQVMRMIGEHLVKVREEMTDEQRKLKEKEGIFSMEEAQA